MFRLWLHFVTAKVYRFFRSELPAAAAWPEPAWHHHQVHIHGQEGDQQTAQTEGEEERVEESVEGNLWKMNHDGRWKEVVWGKGRGKQKVKEPPASSVPATKEDARFLFYFHTSDKFHFSLPPIDISSSSPTFFFFSFEFVIHAATTSLSDIVTSSYTVMKCWTSHTLPCHVHKVKNFLLSPSLGVLHLKMSVMLLSHSLYLGKVTTEQFL